MKTTFNLLLLSLLPLLFSGCITANTITFATHEHTCYLHDDIKHVQKAAVTPDSRLVVWVDGKMAGAKHRGKYTVTASLNATSRMPGVAAREGHYIRRSAIVQGWDTNLLNNSDLISVTVGPTVILPQHQSAGNRRDQFDVIEGTERSLYIVQNEAHDLNLEMVYVDDTRTPRKNFFSFESKNVNVPHRYYLLLWLPLTIPADAATLPFQLLLWPVMSGIRC